MLVYIKTCDNGVVGCAHCKATKRAVSEGKARSPPPQVYAAACHNRLVFGDQVALAFPSGDVSAQEDAAAINANIAVDTCVRLQRKLGGREGR